MEAAGDAVDDWLFKLYGVEGVSDAAEENIGDALPVIWKVEVIAPRPVPLLAASCDRFVRPPQVSLML